MDSCLIVLMGSLGDVVRGFSILLPLKKRYPNCKITWLVEPASEALVRAHPLIDSIIVFNRRNPLSSLIPLIKSLRSEKFSVVLDLQRHLKSGILSFLTKKTKSIGVNKTNAKELNYLFHRLHADYVSDKQSKLDLYRSVLQKAIGQIDDEIDFGLDKNIFTPYMPSFLESNTKYLTLVLGSKWQSKLWMISGYQSLIEQLRKISNCQILLVGDSSQLENSQILEESPNVINMIGKTTLLELSGVIAHSKVIVGPDSGPGHIAAALGVPYITLCGPTDPKRVSPYGFEHLVVQSSIGCSPCWRKRCPGLNNICMRLISPKKVFDLVEMFISK